MPATKTAVALFTEYRKDWDAALNPCIHCLYESCPESEQPALQALLDHYLDSDEGFKTPPYSPVQMRRQQEKLKPLMDRVMNDPAWIANEDQMKAAWRDKPWWRKRWSRLRFRGFMWKLRLSLIGKKPPWE
jgi:hypothetical protein